MTREEEEEEREVARWKGGRGVGEGEAWY